MCRLAGYLGEPRPLSWLLYDSEHSLEHQSYRPNEMVHGTVNVDGSGIAWWNDSDPEPLRYVTDRSLWADPNLPDLARRLTSGAQIAAVRSATPGLAFGPSSVAPFTFERWAFAHNGQVGGFRGSVGRALLDELPDDLYEHYTVVNDSLAIFLTAVGIARRTGNLGEAVAEAVQRVISLCKKADTTATLNVMMSDGSELVATRMSHDNPFNSLYVGDGLIASEPLEQGDWTAVPEESLVTMGGHGTEMGALT